MALTWVCDVPEPGWRGVAPCWTAPIGPVTLRVEMGPEGAWCVSLSYPIGERRGCHEGHAWATLGEAMERGERWARLTIEDWRDLGELARVALRAWDGGQ